MNVPDELGLPSKILVSISNPDDYRLFKRLVALLPQIHIDFLANNLAIYIYLKARKEQVYYPRRCSPDVDPDIAETFSVKTSRLSLKAAILSYGGYFRFFMQAYPHHKWNVVIIPSGRLAGQLGLAEAAKAWKVPMLYTGYGNVDNRIFVDSEGTDKQSKLFRNPELLDAYQPDLAAFEAWRRAYVEARKTHHPVPQAKGVGLKTYLLKLIQIGFCKIERLLGLCSENEYGLKELEKLKPVPLVLDPAPAEDLAYVFFPLQVSTDAQVILNYDKGSLIPALYEAVEIAKRENLTLVVKPHPAELDQRVIDEISALRSGLGFIMTNENTFKLIESSRLVVTINSTVGLEAKLMQKEVVFLGKTMYASFDNKRLAAYISCYLIDEPYFSPEKKPFSVSNARKFFRRSLAY